MSVGEPIDLGGGPRVGPAVPAGQPSAGAGVSLPPAAQALNALVDVDAPADLPGVLERQGDGVVRPIPREDLTTEWFRGHGPPPAVIPGAGRGDMYLDLATGELYRLD